MDKNDFCKAIKGMAVDVWDTSEKPLLLSELPAQLKRLNPPVDYKLIVGTQSLKSFIKDSSEEFGYKLVEHPTQRAKVGLIPSDMEFSFPVEQAKKNLAMEKAEKGEYDGIALMRLLAKLPDSDLEKISIPVSVLVKMFK